MIIPKGTPIIVYNGAIFSKTEFLPGHELHLSKTTHGIHVTDNRIDKGLNIKLHTQLTAVCVMHGIGSIGMDDLFVHAHINSSKPWYLFTSKKYLK